MNFIKSLVSPSAQGSEQDDTGKGGEKRMRGDDESSQGNSAKRGKGEEDGRNGARSARLRAKTLWRTPPRDPTRRRRRKLAM